MSEVSLQESLRKLVFYGPHAGLSVEEMIRMLKAGVSIETLILLITSRLEGQNRAIKSDWVM